MAERGIDDIQDVIEMSGMIFMLLLCITLVVELIYIGGWVLT